MRVGLPACKGALLGVYGYMMQGRGVIVFHLRVWEIFSSHVSVGMGALLFLVAVLFLVGRLGTGFCLNPVIKLF